MPRFRGTVAFLLFLLVAGPAGGAEEAPPRASSPEELLDLGLPRESTRRFRLLPAPERWKTPALPRLLRALADAGEEEAALALFEEARPFLSEPTRSGVLLEAGKIFWRRGDRAKAAAVLGEVRPGAPEEGEAAILLARQLAATGDTAGALRALRAAPDGPLKRLLAGGIAGLRGDSLGALPEWTGALRELRGGADNAPAGRPGAVEELSALSAARLFGGNRAEALEAAREAIALGVRWRSSVGGLRPWDGTATDAEASIAATSSLFPFGEDASRFSSALRRFASLAALHRALTGQEDRALALEGEARRLAGAVRARKELLASSLARARWIGARLRDDARRSGGDRRRLLRAADDASLTAWGERTEPAVAALLEETAEKVSALSSDAARLASIARGRIGWRDTGALPPEDQRMLFFALERLGKAEEAIASLGAKATLLRARAWNRWKGSYARRVTRDLEEAERVLRRVEAQSARAEKAEAALLGSIAELSAWEAALAAGGKRMASDAAALRARRGEARQLAADALSKAREELLLAIARKERTLRRLAGRAAAEWILEGKAVSTDNASAPPPPSLPAEAVRDLEASLPAAGERAPFVDETLFALAVLRFEESSRLRYRGVDGRRDDAADFRAPAELFRKLVEGHPGSRYAESAWYGFSLCLEEAGASDESAQALSGLLAKHPGTRYADEAHLRLGEHRFDRYDFPGAEDAYRKVRDSAAPEITTTARFKLGWSLFLQGRPREAAAKFLEAAVLSPAATRTGGVRDDARRMTARALVEAGAEGETERFLAAHGAAAEGPAVLLDVLRLLEGQNRYEDAAAAATRLGSSYPLAAERLEAEEEAVAALRKAHRDNESFARRGRHYELFGPGTPWREAPGRTAGEISRADALSMEGAAAAGFHFHATTRLHPPGDRALVLSLYDAFLSRFPSSPKAEEVGYQRAWLLFEEGRREEALPAFEAVARRPSGARGEAAWYMAVQCAKELSATGDEASRDEVVRLAKEYRKAFPKGERLHLVLLDRARAHYGRKEWDEAASAATEAAANAPGAVDRRAAHRLAGEAFFEGGRYFEAEKAFREILSASPPAKERAEAEKWVGFSMFKEADRIPASRSAEAGALFLRIAREFPALAIVPEARFRAGAAYAESGRNAEAIDAFLSVETPGAASPLSVDATRRLAALYERDGRFLPAAERLERLSGLEDEGGRKADLLFRSAVLFSRGKDEERSRRAYVAASDVPDAPAPLRVLSLFRSGESARSEGKEREADAHYEAAVKLHREKGGAAPEIAGRALLLLAEARFREYLPMRIGPPLERTYGEKQRALQRCAELYAGAARVGDAETAAAALHRIGEGLEEFRSAILGSPAPPDFTPAEKEEYLFLLEERAAPIEERAVDSYRNSVRQAVAADHFDPFVAKSRDRLRALRPALFGKRAEFAFPVLPVPDFVGITERRGP